MKIAVIGHSFAVDNEGWPSMLGVAQENNFAQKGVSEAKLYMQYLKIRDEHWDKIIVCHSNPCALYTPHHPVHHKKKERAQTDWILGDIEYHRHRDKEMQSVFEYLSKYSDPHYEYIVFDLFLDKMLEIPNSIHITFREDLDKMISTEWIKKIENNFNKIWVMNQGKINHMDIEGNTQVAKQLENVIQ